MYFGNLEFHWKLVLILSKFFFINVLTSAPSNLQIEKDKWKLHQNCYKQKLQPIDGQQTKKRYSKLLEIWIKSTPISNEFQHFQTT